MCLGWCLGRQPAREPETDPMQPSPSLQTKFVVTGFDTFAGVSLNPTELVVRQLEAYIAGQEGLAGGAELLSCTVLKVAAHQVQRWLQEQAAALAEAPPARVVLVHFGVDTHATCHKLEAVARNCANFRVPDEAGWQPKSEHIDPGQRLSCCLRTDLPLDALRDGLRGAGHDVAVSTDAGQFVCNWTYYLSLGLCRQLAQHRWHSLFVHCPPLEVCGEAGQLRLAAAVLDRLGALYPSPEPAPKGAPGPLGAHSGELPLDAPPKTWLDAGEGKGCGEEGKQATAVLVKA